MEFDFDMDIGGMRLLDARNCLRRTLNIGDCSIRPDCRWTREKFEEYASDADTVFKSLLDNGFVESGPAAGRTGKTLLLTGTGRALLAAKAGKRIKRATAEKRLREMVDRAIQINDDRHYIYNVGAIFAFGSILYPDIETVGDVDVSVILVPDPAIPEEDWPAENRRKQEEYPKRKSSFLDEMSWPRQEVMDFLKHRSPVLSIERIVPGDGGLLDRVPCQVVFDGEKAIPLDTEKFRGKKRVYIDLSTGPEKAPVTRGMMETISGNRSKHRERHA